MSKIADTRRNDYVTATGTKSRTITSTVTRYSTERTGLTARVDAGREFATRIGGMANSWGSAVANTVTTAGWVVICASVSGLIAGIAWGWTEGWVIASMSLALLASSAPFLLGHHDYSVGLEFDKDRVVAGTDIAADLTVRNDGNRSALPVLLDIPAGDGLVEAHIPLLRPGTEYRERITIGAHKRGVIKVGPITIARGDPLGILRREQVWPGEQTIYVHPVTVPIPSTSAGIMRDLEGAATTTIVDSDLTFHAIRDYLPGDSRRHMHWKATAKTGTLKVRQFEETRRSRIAIVLDLNETGFATEDDFEMAVSAAASLALQAIREGRDVVITVSAEIPEYARGTVHSLHSLPTLTPRSMLDAMSAIKSSDLRMPLEMTTGMTARESRELSMVFVVTGSKVTTARLRKTSIAFAADVTVIAVKCETGAEPTAKNVRELQVMTIGMLHDLGHMLVRATV